MKPETPEALAETLAGHPLLGKLAPEHRAILVGRARRRELVPAEAIVRQGQVATSWYLLLSGGARLSRTRPDGSQEVLGLVRPGTLFGLVGLMNRGARAATVAAIEPSVALELPADLLDGKPRTPEGQLALALREVVAQALNLQLNAANHQLFVQAAAVSGDAPEDWEARTEGGWKLPPR